MGAVVADVRGSGKLDDSLRVAKEKMAANIVAFCKANPLYYALRILIMIGYLVSLACVGAFVPGSRAVYLGFSLAWSALTYIDGPQIIPKPVILFYDASLLLNGAVLALCYFSPLSNQFDLM